MQKRAARRFPQISRRLLAAFVALACLAVFTFFAPSTSAYKSAVQYLWFHQHPALAYYLNRDDSALAMEIGNYYFDGGAYDLHKAEKSYELAIALSPQIHLANYQLARIFFVEGDFVKARQYIDEELVVDPYTLRSLYVRGLIDLAQNDLSDAESDFTRFVAWSPGEWGGYNDLAFTLAKEGKYSESESVIQQAFKKVPDGESVPWLWNSLGLAQLNQFDFKDAVNSFTQALTLAKGLTQAQWQRAYSADDPSASSDSIVIFQQSIEKNLKIAQANGIV